MKNKVRFNSSTNGIECFSCVRAVHVESERFQCKQGKAKVDADKDKNIDKMEMIAFAASDKPPTETAFNTSRKAFGVSGATTHTHD